MSNALPPRTDEALEKARSLFSAGVRLMGEQRPEEALLSYHQSFACYPLDCTAANIMFQLHHSGRTREAIKFGESVLQGHAVAPALAARVLAMLSESYLAMGDARRAAQSARAWSKLPIPAGDRISALTHAHVAGIHSDRGGFEDHLQDYIYYQTLCGTYEVGRSFDFDHLRNRGRHLNIGYFIPAGVWKNPNWFPPLTLHNKLWFGVYVYQDVAGLAPEHYYASTEDNVTVRHWQDITDDEKAEIIYRDDINILVDTTPYPLYQRGHFFGQKPAPIQVYLGFDKTVSSGSLCFDYFMTDPFLCPPEWDKYYVEKVYRLSHSMVHGFKHVAAERPPERRVRGERPLTFGCFARVEKVTEDYLAAVAEIMSRVSGSRMIFRNSGWDRAERRLRFTELCAALGIADRVAFLGAAPYQEFLATYDSIDLVLDTFPFTGGTTTIEALWHGVPVLSYCCPTSSAGRIGPACLNVLGFDDLIAHSVEEFIARAAALATTEELLDHYRSAGPAQLSRYFVDADERFTQALEEGYRDIWSAWCAASPASAVG
jgi:glycosyltransferase involved in cell wall biosynthesis